MNSYPHRGGTGTDTGTDSDNGNDSADSGDNHRRCVRRRYVIKHLHAVGMVSECKYMIKIFNRQILGTKTAPNRIKKPFTRSFEPAHGSIGRHLERITL